jgi:3'-5' exoribonuclease
MSIDVSSRTTPIADLEDGSCIDRVLIARDVQRCNTRKGSEYLRLVVGDRTGSLPAVMWEPPPDIQASALRIVGRVSDHPRYGRQVVVSELVETDPSDLDVSSLLPGPAESPAELERRLDSTIESVEDVSLRGLVEKLLGRPGELRAQFVRATAAKYNHHAYPGGLLEHSLEVVDAVSDFVRSHPAADRDLAVVGALLHDIGKLESYEDEPIGSDFSDAGRFEGEIPLGYYRVRRAIEQLSGFPQERARELLHVVLSHHGRLEHGSPVVPCTREATIVHAMDELSSRLGAFDRLERDSPNGARWSRYDHVIESAARLSGSPARRCD